MKILIAESKTMSAAVSRSDAEYYRDHSPRFLNEAIRIAQLFAKMDADELTQRIGISPRQAADAARMFYDFNAPCTGIPAFRAFTGVVFHAARLDSLPQQAMERARASLRICSSLYGLLRPDDLIMPYRLDYKVRLPQPENLTLAKFWQPLITPAVAEDNSGSIVNLMPSEAMKCFDLKYLRKNRQLINVEFKTIAEGERFVTPHAGRLKELRGLLLREILMNGADTEADIRSIETDQFMPSGTGTPGLIRFLC